MASTSSAGDVGDSGTNSQTNPGYTECFAWFCIDGIGILAEKNAKGDYKLDGSKGAVADKTLTASANTSSSHQESHDVETSLLDIWVNKFVMHMYRLWTIFLLQCVPIHD
ncbi:hypothetical protein ZEAMMB73_Zm00001d040717 [Zea mays]|uniref:Uncharacterized protein n=1 Tax=Zea mays TaxID=4577 RepID=A0A1D6MSE0_MAIZE|nr:hypothetical protein ZEAMMB73_Zm00001d040717 [Zea mays]